MYFFHAKYIKSNENPISSYLNETINETFLVFFLIDLVLGELNME